MQQLAEALAAFDTAEHSAVTTVSSATDSPLHMEALQPPATPPVSVAAEDAKEICHTKTKTRKSGLSKNPPEPVPALSQVTAVSSVDVAVRNDDDVSQDDTCDVRNNDNACHNVSDNNSADHNIRKYDNADHNIKNNDDVDHNVGNDNTVIYDNRYADDTVTTSATTITPVTTSETSTTPVKTSERTTF